MTGPGNAGIDGLCMIIQYAKDPEASAAFYRDLLGLRAKEVSAGWAEFEVGGGVSIACTRTAKMPAAREAARPWVVLSCADVVGTWRRLLARGVTFLTPPVKVYGDETTTGLSADLEDPDGNRLSLLGSIPTKYLPADRTFAPA